MMHRLRRWTAVLGLAVLLAVPPALAQERGAGAPAAPGVLSLLPGDASVRQSITVAGRRLDYDATMGTVDLLAGDGRVTAKVFYTSYRLPGGGRDRPVTFVFNGGPGAASAYLHLGAMGPKVVATARDGDFLPPPQRLVDNPDTWLPFTDLVFVDPPGTGYSRAASDEDEKRFFSVEGDRDALGAFIRLWLQKAGRTGSPIVLAGESYGGFRAAELSRSLARDVGLAPAAAILISPALEFALLYADDWQPLGWALSLPSFAAVKLGRDGLSGAELEARLRAAESFALGDYLTALARGTAAGRTIATRVAELVGLPAAEIEKTFGRVPTSLFIKRLEPGRLLSRYDGLIGGPDPNPSSPRADGPDAVLDRSVPVLTEAFVAYARDVFGFKTQASYRVLDRRISGSWNYGGGGSRQGFAGVLGDLQEARALNPALRVMIAHGYTDLITPYFASSFLVSQLPPLTGAPPIELRTYMGGHMMYLRADSRAAFTADARSLIEGRR